MRQTVIILALDATECAWVLLLLLRLDVGCLSPCSRCPRLAINGQIGAGLVVRGGLEIPIQRSESGGEGVALGGRQSIVLDKSCESMADLQKCLDFFSYDLRFHGSIPFLHDAHVDMEARYCSLGYFELEARRSSLSNAQIMTNANPAPVSISNTGMFAYIRAGSLSGREGFG